jgi:hypothetical protein
MEKPFDGFAAIHPAISIRHGGEVERYGVKAIRCGFKPLPVDKGLHDENTPTHPQRRAQAGKDLFDLLLGKTIEKLAHPDDVVFDGPVNLTGQ